MQVIFITKTSYLAIKLTYEVKNNDLASEFFYVDMILKIDI